MTKKGISWRTHIIELLVVIIGISIAFALEGWSEKSKEDALEVNYLNSLKADLLKDQNDLSSVLDSSTRISSHVRETFGMIYSNQDLLSFKRHHITSAYTAPYFYPNNGTYISLVNSGSLNIIKSFDIKSSLAELYNVQYRELERVDNFVKNLVDDQIYPYMLKNIKFSFERDGIESIAPLKENIATNMLGSYLNFLDRRGSTYLTIKSNLQTIIDAIDGQLEQ